MGAGRALQAIGTVEEKSAFRKLPAITIPKGVSGTARASKWLASEASMKVPRGCNKRRRRPLVSFSNRSRPYAASRGNGVSSSSVLFAWD